MNGHSSSDSEGGRSTTPSPSAPCEGAAQSVAFSVGSAACSPSAAASVAARGLAAAHGPVSWTPSQLKSPKPSRKRADKRAGNSCQAFDAESPERDQRAAGRSKHRCVREYSVGEEVANAVSHGVGALLAIAAIPILVVKAVGAGGGVYLAAALVYSLTMLVEYVMSTLYHALAADGAKRVFKVLDHSCIYLFIAGSYTPFCLITLQGSGGVPLCCAVWVLALVGVAFEAFWVFRPRWVSAVLYLLLGWCVVACLPQLVTALPAPGLWLLVAGGACYTVGCVFYVLKKIPYLHFVFHLWVVAGSVLHFLAIALYVM